MNLIKGTLIDWNYIRSKEGFREKTYVLPYLSFPNSGVTVATGFDLGSKNMKVLIDAGLTDYSKKRLEPFLGLKGKLAHEAHEQLGPVTLHITQLDALDKYGINNIIIAGIKIYNDDRSSFSKPFSQLSKTRQTVLAYRFWHWGAYYGNHGKEFQKKFWKKVIENNWREAAIQLRDFSGFAMGGVKAGYIEQAYLLENDSPILP